MTELTSSAPESERRPDLPRGTVTLLFTDIEASTQLLETLGAEYPDAILRSDRLVQNAITSHAGIVADTQGDACFAAFSHARDAVRAAVAIQRAFASEGWPSKASVRVRIGVHTGQPTLVGGKYFGLDVHRAARIAAAARGGHVLLSAATRGELKDGDLPANVEIRDRGTYRLKDIRYPEVLFDLSIADLPDDFGPFKSVEPRPNNLPATPTTFVGREQALRDVCTLLLRPTTRLLTLTGPGGTGKTRLSIEAACSLLDRFFHGVFLVELAPVSDPNLLASTIVQTLGIPEFASRTSLETLKHHLAQGDTLLVLDNFEQIVSAAMVVVELLNACPNLKVLVTSREALNVRLEREYLVSPLEVPDRTAQRDLQSVEMIESVQLFVDRAQAHDQHFMLTAENVEAVCGICRRLDGLPLALELAAAQLKLFTPQSLLEHLQSSIEVLAGGARDLADHQRTLKDTIAWSYQLLLPGEQLLFRRLSVVRGGSTADSAVALGSDGQSPAEVLDALSCLVRKSLLTQEHVGGETRLGMLQTLQEFGRQQLNETAESAHVYERHARHYLGVAETMAPGLMGREQRRSVTALLAEEDNLRAAIAWGIEQDDRGVTSRLICALLWLWITRGQFADGKTWTKRALDKFARLGPIREVALILEAAGWLAVLGGDYAAALPVFERSYEIFHVLTDVRDQARAKTTLGVTCLVLGDPRGIELSDQAVTLSRGIPDDKWGLALALLSAGIKHQVTGNAALATSCYEESLQAFYLIDNVYWPGQILQNLAHLRLQAGDWQRAATLAAEALEIGRQYNYPMITSQSLAVMGAVAVARGIPERAAQFFGAVEASLSRLGVTLEPPEHAAMQVNLDAARAILTDQEFTAAFHEGRCWREQDIVAAALSLQPEAPA